ncbi:hypothetical protein FB45DRAFT_997604 [Roridomyces roridus]|uniref:Uncharacterized protein n=1 Tax=Roridomyces roridus TaxID=1738132 RepID=A0AAD7CK29_9AGAR|nr:hypothetical protein FB45DRAFT_997604 [Roridomyces roridus]
MSTDHGVNSRAYSASVESESYPLRPDEIVTDAELDCLLSRTQYNHSLSEEDLTSLQTLLTTSKPAGSAIFKKRKSSNVYGMSITTPRYRTDSLPTNCLRHVQSFNAPRNSLPANCLRHVRSFNAPRNRRGNPQLTRPLSFPTSRMRSCSFDAPGMPYSASSSFHTKMKNIPRRVSTGTRQSCHRLGKHRKCLLLISQQHLAHGSLGRDEGRNCQDPRHGSAVTKGRAGVRVGLGSAEGGSRKSEGGLNRQPYPGDPIGCYPSRSAHYSPLSSQTEQWAEFYKTTEQQTNKLAMAIRLNRIDMMEVEKALKGTQENSKKVATDLAYIRAELRKTEKEMATAAPPLSSDNDLSSPHLYDAGNSHSTRFEVSQTTLNPATAIQPSEPSSSAAPMTIPAPKGFDTWLHFYEHFQLNKLAEGQALKASNKRITSTFICTPCHKAVVPCLHIEGATGNFPRCVYCLTLRSAKCQPPKAGSKRVDANKYPFGTVFFSDFLATYAHGKTDMETLRLVAALHNAAVDGKKVPGQWMGDGQPEFSAKAGDAE